MTISPCSSCGGGNNLLLQYAQQVYGADPARQLQDYVQAPSQPTPPRVDAVDPAAGALFAVNKIDLYA